MSIDRVLTAAAVALTACALLTVAPVLLAFAQRGWLGVVLVPYLAWLLIAASLAWGYVALAGRGNAAS